MSCMELQSLLYVLSLHRIHLIYHWHEGKHFWVKSSISWIETWTLFSSRAAPGKKGSSQMLKASMAEAAAQCCNQKVICASCDGNVDKVR